jgi:HSP20 family molecular chaperone IbpA
MAEAIKEGQKKEAQAPEGVERTRDRRVFVPRVDIIERNDDLVLIADMPGVDEKSLDITVEKNILTINGYVEPEVPDKHKLVYAEYSVGDYQRTFTLSDERDRERIQASIKNGVLRLILPKVEAAKVKKIAVKAEA